MTYQPPSPGPQRSAAEVLKHICTDRNLLTHISGKLGHPSVYSLATSAGSSSITTSEERNRVRKSAGRFRAHCLWSPPFPSSSRLTWFQKAIYTFSKPASTRRPWNRH